MSEHSPSYTAQRAINEQRVADQVGPQITEYTVLCDRINDAVSGIVAKEPTGAGRPMASLVVTRLVLRLLDDFRVCALLIDRGYVLQAHATIAGVLEVACAAAYIGDSEERADKWLDHKPTGITYPPRKPALRAAVALFGGGPEHEEIFDKQYEQACMSKHNNPHVLTQVGLLGGGDHPIELLLGPYYSDDIVRISRRVLAQAAWYVLLGAVAFVHYHIALPETMQQAHLQVRELMATLRALDVVEIARVEQRRRTTS